MSPLLCKQEKSSSGLYLSHGLAGGELFRQFHHLCSRFGQKNVSYLGSMCLLHFILIAQPVQIFLLYTMADHFALCHAWYDASITQAAALVRHVIVLHNLRRRLRHVWHHVLNWRRRVIYVINCSLIIPMSCGMKVKLLIEVVNVHLLMHKLYVLT